MQKLESSFIHIFLSETKVYFFDGPVCLVHVLRGVISFLVGFL